MRSSHLFLMLIALPLGACSTLDKFNLPSWMGGGSKKIEKVEGERLAITRSETTLGADDTLGNMEVVVADVAANAEWPQHGGMGETRIEHAALPTEFTNRQEEVVGDNKKFERKLVVTPVVANGVVYAMDAGGHISAHTLADIGDILWISPGVAAGDDTEIMGGGLAAAGGRLFATSGRGLLVALNASSGVELWRQSLGIPIRSAPRVHGDKVYVVTVDSQLMALDASTGALLWTHRGVNEGTGFLIEASPAANNEAVIAPYSSGEIHALRSDDGSEVWSDGLFGAQRSSATAFFTGIGADPVLVDNILYVAGSAGVFAAYDLNRGKRIWEQPISSVNTPWVSGDYVFVLTTDANLMALHRLDGRVKWVAKLEQYAKPDERTGAYTWSGPVLAGGRLLVAGAHGEMVEIAPKDGSIVARQSIPDGVYASPVVAGGKLLLVTDGARLEALF